MPAGTITLTNNSTAVTGSGTAFPTELKANDFLVAVVGGTTYTLGVKSVESATALTLTTAYGGPTTGGLAWTPIPNGTLVGITAQIAADTARAIRGLNYDKQNWQQVYSASGNITVMLPDGSTWAGPSWNGVSTKLNGKLDKSENLNDLGDKAQSQKNLGLGDSAVRDVNKLLVSDSSPSVPVMLQMNSDFRNVISYDTLGEYPLGLSAGLATGKQLPGSGVAQGGFVGLINARTWGNNSAGQCSFQIAVNDNVAGFRRTYIANGTWFYSNFLSWYHSGNTTRASDGTLKAASPVVKIFANGNAETNEESEGVTVTRQAPGVYLVEG
ncbi:hypothetical protein EDF88_0958, partial [Buttiauxella sp. BIGb0552]|uniref:phage tail fiber protein n=1 Tax=Buttiauxella sp. BIGb0552 TaxID=2485120 RepID=UPI0010E59708